MRILGGGLEEDLEDCLFGGRDDDMGPSKLPDPAPDPDVRMRDSSIGRREAVERAMRARMDARDPVLVSLEDVMRTVPNPPPPVIEATPALFRIGRRDVVSVVRSADLSAGLSAGDVPVAEGLAVGPGQSAGRRVSAAGPKEDRARVEALRLGARLADLVSHSPVSGPVTPEMRSLAAGICSALGGKSSESRPGRALAKDLVPGGLYVAKGWATGEWEWTYVGPVPGDASRMTVRRADGRTSVELLGDHGLAPYDEDQQGKFWHPTNWTEGTGVGDSTGRMVSDAAGMDVADVGMPLRDEDEF